MAGPESLVPQQYLLGSAAPRPRTLWDIITTTAEMNPDAAALDDGEIITYSELIHEVELWAAELHANGVRRGDRIGIRMTSGKRELYLAILATLAAGAAYVPGDADDPDERAEMVFGEADIDGVFTDGRSLMLTAAKDKACTGEEFAEDPIAPDTPESELDGWLASHCGF